MNRLSVAVLVAALGVTSCSVDSAPAVGRATQSVEQACPCDPGMICGGDELCYPDCSVYQCAAGYFCDWSSLMCAPVPVPPPPVPFPNPNDCHITGCPAGYVCGDSPSCELEGTPVHTGCWNDSECPGGQCIIDVSVGTCTSGQGSGCTFDSDCDSDWQCSLGHVCVHGNDGSACVNNYDCQVGFACHNGYCR